MKNVPDAPLLTKLLALASVPGVGTLGGTTPTSADPNPNPNPNLNPNPNPSPDPSLNPHQTPARPLCSSSPSSEASWSTTHPQRRAALTPSRRRTTLTLTLTNPN
eukprot:scaffold71397_cov60-Phaeocystis_antarctica.AAC.8